MRPRSWADLALTGALALAISLVGGCDATSCDTAPESNPPSDFKDGQLVTSSDGTVVFQTSAPDGQHLNFSAGTQYRVYHRLEGRPLLVQPWVSFSSTGTKGGNEAVPAGNMTEILDVNDQFIQIRNNSCGDYWLRLVATHPEK